MFVGEGFDVGFPAAMEGVVVTGWFVGVDIIGVVGLKVGPKDKSYKAIEL